MVHNSDRKVYLRNTASYLRNTASHSQQEADALVDALSSLGLRPGHPAPGHRVFRSVAKQALLAATAEVT